MSVYLLPGLNHQCLLITVSIIHADSWVMRKLEPESRYLGKRLTSDVEIVILLPEMVTSSAVEQLHSSTAHEANLHIR